MSPWLCPSLCRKPKTPYAVLVDVVSVPHQPGHLQKAGVIPVLRLCLLLVTTRGLITVSWTNKWNQVRLQGDPLKLQESVFLELPALNGASLTCQGRAFSCGPSNRIFQMVLLGTDERQQGWRVWTRK